MKIYSKIRPTDTSYEMPNNTAKREFYKRRPALMPVLLSSPSRPHLFKQSKPDGRSISISLVPNANIGDIIERINGYMIRS